MVLLPAPPTPAASAETTSGQDFQDRAQVIDLLARLQPSPILAIAEQGGWLYKDHWAVDAVFQAAVDLQQEVKAALKLTVAADGDPMLFLKDLLKRRLGLEMKKSKKVTKAILEKEGHLKNLSAPVLDHPPLTVGEYRNLYQILECPHRAELMAAISLAHTK